MLDELIPYVESKLSLFRDLKPWLPHLRKELGHPMQRALLAQLYSLFPDGGSRVGTGPTHLGYYFGEWQGARRGWYGFVSTEEITGYSGEAPTELVVVTGFRIDAGPMLDPIALADNWMGKRFEQHAVRIAFDDSWNEAAQWREVLRSVQTNYQAVPKVGY